MRRRNQKVKEMRSLRTLVRIRIASLQLGGANRFSCRRDRLGLWQVAVGAALLLVQR